MLKKLKISDVDNLMNFWKKEIVKTDKTLRNKNISNDYNNTKECIIKNIDRTIIYTEDDEIRAFICINENNEIKNIIVKSDIQREGIGSLLIEYAKKRNNELFIRINEQNSILKKFIEANEFGIMKSNMKSSNEMIDQREIGNDSIVKIKEQSITNNCIEQSIMDISSETTMQNTKKIEKKKNQNVNYIVYEWKKTLQKKCTIVYYDDDINESVIKAHNEIDFRNIELKKFIKNEKIEKLDDINIKNYIKMRKKIEKIFDIGKIYLYIDYNNYNEYTDELIKEVAKINKIDLKVVICEPFSIEAKKKKYIIEQVEKSFEKFEVIKLDCGLDKNETISVNQIFQKKSEILVNKILQHASKNSNSNIS